MEEQMSTTTEVILDKFKTLTLDQFKGRERHIFNDARMISILSQKIGLDFMPLSKDEVQEFSQKPRTSTRKSTNILGNKIDETMKERLEIEDYELDKWFGQVFTNIYVPSLNTAIRATALHPFL